MKTVVLTGTESVGKSTLARALANHFGALYVGEYVRAFIEQKQRDTCYADIETIAQAQWNAEQHARAQAVELVILDTHLLSNWLWSKTLFNKVPAWIEPTLITQRYDAIFLLHPEGMVWQADGQRCLADSQARLAFHHEIADWLNQQQQNPIIIQGSWQQRYDTLLTDISQLLANG